MSSSSKKIKEDVNDSRKFWELVRTSPMDNQKGIVVLLFP